MIRRILSGVIFLTLDGATIGTYRGEIFSWANLVGVNSTQTTYKVSGGIRQQFFVVQMRSVLAIPGASFSVKADSMKLKEQGLILLNHLILLIQFGFLRNSLKS